MGAIAFLLLFFLGLLLSTIGSIVGIVDAFRVNTVWGLLALFVPFALLVYCVKFWGRKWARNGLIMGLSGLGLTLLSFPFLGGFITQQVNRLEQQPDLTVETLPTEPDATGEFPEGDGTESPDQVVEPAEDEELFQEAMLPGLPSAAQIALAELLPSTDPNERLKEIQRDRPDPFAYVPIPPPPQAAPPAPATPPPGTARPPATQPSPNAGAPGRPGGANGGDGTSPTQPGGIEPLPQLPDPTTLASQVVVTGVAQVNGEMYAIVKAPRESTSRYVKEGDLLSNGAVLVKRIETRSESNPVVVLEERGIEVPLSVGANVNQPEESTAMQPSTPSQLATLPLLP
jgi:hypothetical protein